MKYIINLTNTDTDEQRTVSIDTNGIKAAHEHAAHIAEQGETFRVYVDTDSADGHIDAALNIARRSAMNSIQRTGGTDTQRAILSSLDNLRSCVEYRLTAGAGNVGEYIMTRLYEQEHSADALDFINTAALAISEQRAAGADIAEQYHAAYIAINHLIIKQRAATEHELSTEYIMDGNGDIVAINTAIAAIMRGGDKWTETDGGTMDSATAAQLGAAIRGACALLNPTQRRIIELTGRGYSMRQIAEQTRRELATVARNVAIARATIADYINGNAAQFAALIDSAATQAAAQAARAARHSDSDRRTATGAARKRASDKATQAARAAAYRARKKAAAQAAAEKAQAAAMYRDCTQRPIAQAAAILRNSIK